MAFALAWSRRKPPVPPPIPSIPPTPPVKTRVLYFANSFTDDGVVEASATEFAPTPAYRAVVGYFHRKFA